MRRIDLRTRETGALGQLFEERPLEGRGVSACGTLLSDAGDNALKDKRPATSEELEEMLEGHQRLSEGVAERRDTDVSGATDFNYREGQGTTFPLRNQQKKFRPANADGGERAGTALFAVSVRSTARVGRTTDTLRYLYAASPLQRLLQFYPEHRAMARRSATRKCQFGAGA